MSEGAAHPDDPKYWAMLRQRLHEGLKYPPSARRRALSGVVEIELTVKADGRVADVTVARSSAHPVLDEAAVDAARRMPRLPAPPGAPGREVRTAVPVAFEVR